MEHLDVVHRAAHEPIVLHPTSVVGERHGTGGDHVADLGERGALETLGDGTYRIDVDDTLRGGLLDEEGHLRATVADRFGVGHRGDPGEPTMGRGPTAAGDGLLVFITGLPQMHVDVHQTGDQHLAGEVHDLGVRRLETLSHRHDAAILDEHVTDGIKPCRRVDDPGTLKQQSHHGLLPT